jgi:hypothetical protein
VLLPSTAFYVGHDLVHFLDNHDVPLLLTYLSVDWCTMGPLFVEGLFALLCLKGCRCLDAICEAPAHVDNAALVDAFTRLCHVARIINQRYTRKYVA